MGEEQSGMEKLRTHVGMGTYWGLFKLCQKCDDRARLWAPHTWQPAICPSNVQVPVGTTFWLHLPLSCSEVAPRAAAEITAICVGAAVTAGAAAG